MNAPTRLAASAAVLGLAFGAAALAGATIDPTDVGETAGAGHGGHGPAMDWQSHGQHGDDSLRLRGFKAERSEAPDRIVLPSPSLVDIPNTRTV